MPHFPSKTVAATLALITFISLSSPRSKAESENAALPGPKAHSIADYSDPTKTYQTYLEAIKRDDLAAAKACCVISDNNTSGSLDVLVGMWVAFHRFNKVALLHFNEQVSPYLRDGVDNEENPYLREDCTDTALNRTISRLAGSKFVIDGDRAKLTIKWEDDDGYPNPAFGYSNDALVFRKLEGFWKLDIAPDAGPENLDELFKPGSWGCALRDGMNLLNAAIEDIESGKLRTWQQVTEELEKRSKVLEAKWVKDHEDPTGRAKEQVPSKDEPPSKLK